MHAIWTGAIGFGLVNIPVRIFSAVQDSRLDLDMLDARDHSNIKYSRINEVTGKEVKWENIVKGYKYNDNYIVLTDDDFEKVSPQKSKIIEISSFVDREEIEPTFYEMPYYLEPAKGGEKAYSLLREALKKSKKVAIGQFVLRTKESLCMLLAHDDVILLMRMRFAEEIKDYSDLKIPGSTKISAAEMKMAVALINQLTPASFKIENFKDTYDADLLKIVKQKAKGKNIPKPRLKVVRNKNMDLIAQLKESLEAKKRKRRSLFP